MKRIAASIALSLIWAASASAFVTLESLSIAPPSPTTADSIVASVGGMVNVLDMPNNFRTEWKREGTDILVDVLRDFVPQPPQFPPLILPYTEQAMLGNLPAGTYDLTARLFAVHRSPGESPFPDLWTFPETYNGFVGTLAATFTVVPEPSSLALVIAGAFVLLASFRSAH